MVHQVVVCFTPPERYEQKIKWSQPTPVSPLPDVNIVGKTITLLRVSEQTPGRIPSVIQGRNAQEPTSAWRIDILHVKYLQKVKAG
jgi:hypothetical protein